MCQLTWLFSFIFPHNFRSVNTSALWEQTCLRRKSQLQWVNNASLSFPAGPRAQSLAQLTAPSSGSWDKRRKFWSLRTGCKQLSSITHHLWNVTAFQCWYEAVLMSSFTHLSDQGWILLLFQFWFSCLYFSSAKNTLSGGEYLWHTELDLMQREWDVFQIGSHYHGVLGLGTFSTT